MKYLHKFTVIAALLLFSSFLITSNLLNSNQIRSEEKDSITQEMLKNAAAFKRALTNNGEKKASVYMYNNLTVQNYPGKEGAQRLAEKTILLGFTDVYLAVHPVNGNAGSEFKNKEWIRAFNSYLRKYDINVHALMFSDAAQFNPANNHYIYNHASMIQQYNQSVNKDERFAGAAADWEPHSLTKGNKLSGLGNEDEEGANLSPEACWDNGLYIKDGANDKLLKRTGEMLEYAKESLNSISQSTQLPMLVLSEAVNYHVQEQFDRGNLVHGDIVNYISNKRCENVNVMAYNHQKEEVWRRAEFILNAAERNNLPNSVYIGIKTRLGDDEGPVTSLKPKGWDYLLETLQYLHTQSASYTGMKGINIYEFSDLEEMWVAASKKGSTTGIENPADDITITQTLDYAEINKPVKQIRLYNLSGRLIKSIKGENRLYYYDVPEGVYLIQVTTEDNKSKAFKIHIR